MFFAVIITLLIVVCVLGGLADAAGKPYQAPPKPPPKHAAGRPTRRKWPRIGPEVP